MSDPLFFPILEQERWQWPMPPLQWLHVHPDDDAPQPCDVETPSGSVVHGEMVAIDPPAGTLTLRTSCDGPSVTLPFTRVRRLSLTRPLLPASHSPGAPVERVPASAQERDYRLHGERGEPISGRTAGHLETPEGMFLFTPVDEARALQRVFVPRSAYRRAEFGLSTEEMAAQHWIATKEALLEAIAAQPHARVKLMGQALLELGLVTPLQLERALAHRSEDHPLGETLAAEGVISQGNLQTALAYKMGYPLVDLTRFPIDRDAVKKLPLRLALEARAVPLMVDGQRLIVAVDRPARAEKLRAVSVFLQLSVVPVLASKTQILFTLIDLSKQKTWSEPIPPHLSFFVTSY